MSELFTIRAARLSDAPQIAVHRARMFQDMGLVPDELFDSYRERCETRLREMLATGEYVGWLASRKKAPDDILAGAGVQLRRVLPHPAGDLETGITIAQGRHAIIINVFTEPPWRRHGLATLLLDEIIRWAGNERLDRLVLHASDEGRRVYERLGFISTNEMRYSGRLEPDAIP